jgi:hypothetical protein
MGPEGKTEQYYRYTGPDGRVYIVQSPDSLPAGARDKAELVVLNPARTREEQTLSKDGPRFELQGASFGVGFACALLLALLYRVMPGGMRWFTRMAIVGGIGILGAGLYLGYLRNTTTAAGAAASPLASPSSIIQDARDAVEKAQTARQKQEQEIRDIQAQGR